MTRRGIVLAALHFGLGVLMAPPLAAEPAGKAIDYWAGMGRFVTIGGDDLTKDPPDLSGTYKVDGKLPAGEAYAFNLTIKNKRTVETPQGAHLRVYEASVDQEGGPATGIAVLIGHRLYVALGSKSIALSVGAPFVLTPEEASVDRRARGLKAQVDEKNKDYDDKIWHKTKGAPWFSAVNRKEGGDFYHRGRDATGDGTGYYVFWFEAKGLSGEEFHYGVDAWVKGTHTARGYILDKGNKACGGRGCIYSSSVRVVPGDENFLVKQTTDGVELPGTGHVLEDGTFVAVMGGSAKGGAGAGYCDFVDGKLSGKYWHYGMSYAGTWALTPDETIVVANPTLFVKKGQSD
jgi:hypothetical protein